MSIPCLLEKDCNSDPISTFPPCYAFQMNWPLGRFSLKVAMSVIGKKTLKQLLINLSIQLRMIFLHLSTSDLLKVFFFAVRI